MNYYYLDFYGYYDVLNDVKVCVMIIYCLLKYYDDF